MKEQILSLYSQGFSYNQIVDKLGCSKGTVSYHCGRDQVSKTNIRNLNRKRKNKIWLEEYKQSLCCSNCPESRYWVLDFHHFDSDFKEKTVSQMIKTASRKRVIEEIEKCIVLCANCHRDLHHHEKINSNSFS